MIFLTFEWVDQQNEESEKEFDSIARAIEWLKGQRVDDFIYIYMIDDSGEEVASCYYSIMEFNER